MPTEVNLPDTIGKGYGRFWYFTGRYRCCKGSRASKKSKTTALWFIYHLMKYPLANALCVRQTFNTLQDSCWADLHWAAARLGVSHLWEFTVSPLKATYKPTGQVVLFRGLDDPLRLASVTVSVGVLCWAWLEEAYEIPTEADFDMIDDVIRGQMPEGYFKQLTLTFNPWSHTTWIKKRFFDHAPDPDILAMTTNYMCNEWLDEADHRRFERMKEENRLSLTTNMMRICLELLCLTWKGDSLLKQRPMYGRRIQRPHIIHGVIRSRISISLQKTSFGIWWILFP